MSALVPLFLDVAVSVSKLSFTKVRRYTLADGLNMLPELTVEVFSTDADIDMAALAGQPAVVELGEPAVPRFDGIVRQVEQRAMDIAGVSVYVLTVVPRSWLLTQRSAHRIFQNRTAVDIVSDLLAPGGATIDRSGAALFQRELPAYEYRVQWGETDHDFLFRVLAEEGLVSYWAPDSTGERGWVITDDTTSGAIDMDLPYSGASGALASTGPHVSAVTVQARVCSSGVKLRDYDYQNPPLLLQGRCVSADGSHAEDGLVRYGYGVGRFDDERAGESLAAVQLAEARAKSRTCRWESSFALRAGMRVRLHDHPRDDANGEFVVVSSWTEVDLSAKKHIAEVIPAAQAWRPERRPKPRIHGAETAFVVGAPGKEIDVDALGRVEVEFRWDTRDLHRNGASRRVRVATPWAGPGRGLWTAPRVGDEVVIAYLHGDPDQPLVVGNVNNAAAPPAAALPANQTQSWWKSKTTPGGDGFNAILMEDAKGSELLALYGERDSLWNTQRRAEVNVGEDQIVRIHGSQSVSIGGGQSVGAGNVSVAASGEYKIKAAKIDVQSTGDMSFQCGGTRTDVSAVAHSIVAPTLSLVGVETAALAGGHVFVTGDKGGAIVLQVGSSSIELSADKITIKSPLVEINP